MYTFFWSIFNLIKVYISRHNQIVFFDDPKPFHFSIFIKYIQENPKKKKNQHDDRKTQIGKTPFWSYSKGEHKLPLR